MPKVDSPELEDLGLYMITPPIWNYLCAIIKDPQNKEQYFLRKLKIEPKSESIRLSSDAGILLTDDDFHVL